MIPMGRTRKVGPAGKFGSRYGRRIREEYSRIYAMQHKKYECPKCKKVSVKRIAPGIWECKKCGAKFAGAAFETRSKLLEEEVK